MLSLPFAQATIAPIARRVRREYHHFLQLSADSRRLLLSFALYLTAYPLLNIFTNAYLWRFSGDVGLVVLYNMGLFIGLPTGFYLNGLLLRRFHTTQLYAAGMLAQGLAPLLIVFLQRTDAPTLIVLGVVYGLGGGVFWGNKNYLSVQLTRKTNRMYFAHFEMMMDQLANIVVPFCIGTFLSLGIKASLFTAALGYQVLMATGFLLLLWSGHIIKKSHIDDFSPRVIFLWQPHRMWQRMRVHDVLFNTVVGIHFFLPNMIILLLLGAEGTLGAIGSASAGLAALATYIISRKGSMHHIFWVIMTGNMLYLGGALMLGWQYSPLGALVFSAAITMGNALRWSSQLALSMETVERSARHLQSKTGATEEEATYAHVCDEEIFFNVGRVLGVSVFMMFAMISTEAAVRWSSVFLVAVQFLGLPVLRGLVRETAKK